MNRISFCVVVWVIVRVCSVVLRRTVVGVDWRFDNLSGSHHQSRWCTLMMASAQVVETSVNTNNSPSQDYTTNPDDHSNHNIDSPGFKPFTVRSFCLAKTVAVWTTTQQLCAGWNSYYILTKFHFFFPAAILSTILSVLPAASPATGRPAVCYV